MNCFTSLRRLVLCLALPLAFVARLGAEEATNTVKFSDPSKPGTLHIAVAQGDVHIVGADTQEVSVTTEAQRHGRPRKDGLRVLTEAATFALAEKDNVVSLDAADGWMGTPSNFKIVVPRSTNVVVASSMGGDIVCSGVGGDIEIKSLHGEVRLEDTTGGVVVDTMNGEIVANVRELREGKAMSFTSMNGQVAVRLPGNAKANVRLRTQNGTILTDFDDKTLVTRVENMGGGRRRGKGALAPEVRDAVREAARVGAVAAQRAAAAMREAAEAAREGLGDSDDDDGGHVAPVAPLPPIPPSIPTVSGGKLVTGTLNGGGPEISVTTMNGDVTLRQLK